MRIEKPWGYEELWALTGKYAGKLLFINAGESLSLQYHETKEETLRIMSGALSMTTIDEDGILVTKEMRDGEVEHIAPRVRHRMTAVDDCVVLEVSTPQLDDVVRLADKYGRI